ADRSCGSSGVNDVERNRGMIRDLDVGNSWKAQTGKPGRGDTHDGDRMIVQANGASDDAWIGVQATAPDAIADHRERRARLVVGWTDQTSALRADPEQLEVVAVDDIERGAARHAVDVEGGLRRAEHRQCQRP